MKRPEQLAKLTEVCVKCARDSRKPRRGEGRAGAHLTGREGTDAYPRGAALEEDTGPARRPDRTPSAMGAVRRVYADTELRRVKVSSSHSSRRGGPSERHTGRERQQGRLERA
ncbi:MAG: hypothetical protein ACLUEK_15530 [Oscillospiraceae bacterium]